MESLTKLLALPTIIGLTNALAYNTAVIITLVRVVNYRPVDSLIKNYFGKIYTF